MKKSIFTPVLLVVLLMATSVKAQMGIGTATPHSSAQLDVSSVLKGFLAPRMTLSQRNAVATPAEGLLVYQTDNTPGFYYYNGTAWVALSGSGGSAGVDLTSNQSVGGLKTFTSVDGLLATGGGAGGVASSLGAGSRMMWYPRNAAFRAGNVSGTQWDDANIGLFSIAMGGDTKASGQNATAMGYNTLASGSFSTAMGSGTTASGSSATAMGYNTLASGLFSTAMGYQTTASGSNSIAMGSQTTASGRSATAMGESTSATADASTAIGSSTTASGYASIAMGVLTTAKSFAETAIGLNNTDYTPTSSSSINSSDRLFVIGNGTFSVKSDALVMLKNGNTTFGGSVAVMGNGTGTSYTLPTTRGTANYVLTTDGVGGTSWAAAASGGGGAAGVDLTTAQSVGGLKTFTSVDGLLATGTYGSGTASSLGESTRMMWYPKKAAFRAGYVSGTQWDDANIGNFSVAMGNDTKANGRYSTAFGFISTASGQAATAMGANTTASGNTSTAMGYGTTASSSYATAMGYNSIASQLYSTAMGNSTTASADYATAMGKSTTASGQVATAMGNLTTASAISSTAMGSQTTASGIYATAFGSSSTASGRSATAMGEATTASGEKSTAMGSSTIASGNGATVMGVGTTSLSYGETTIGFWNTDYTPSSTLGYSASDRLFVIGNGEWNAKSDALVMLKNGNTTFSGTVTATVVAPTSDARLKRNIVPLKNSIEAIMQLKPVSYEKKNSLTSTEYNITENGFIAQELQKVMPSLVVEGTDKDKLLSVNYTAIIPVLTKAIQEQQKQIAELKKMVEQLMKK